ncbi:MAG: ATP-binding protein [Leeuwenhoekiella sp.]
MERAQRYPDDVNLTNCDKEPIHLIGKTQGFGALLAVKLGEDKLSYHSTNTSALLNASEENLLDHHLADILGEGVSARITKFKAIDEPVVFQEQVQGKEFIFVLHDCGNYRIIEIEPLEENVDALGYQMQLSSIFSSFSETKTEQELCHSAVKLIKNFLGYDRVMIYRFDEEYNGEVVAESAEPDLEPFLGLRYPATDIPKQARKLFLTKGVRIITAVEEIPNAIYGNAAADTLDLTDSELRASSPIHIEYLKNMGVGASLTAAIKNGNKLWGLIACHHNTPKKVNYYKRMSCKFLTQVFSTQLLQLQNSERLEQSQKAGKIQAQLIAQASENWDVVEGLMRKPVTMLDLFKASGAAIHLDGKISILGKVPPENEIMDLLKWVATNMRATESFITKNLSKEYPGGQDIKSVASGVMLLWLNREMHDALIWFKPEEREEVTWAGNPDKEAARDKQGQLRPRNSFAKWTEVQSGVAAHWWEYELEAARGLKQGLIGIIIKKYDEVSQLHGQLQQAYKELELFSYAVSHDLRSPLHGIYGFAKVLEEDYAEKLDDFGKTSVESIVESTNRMNRLIDDILQFAHRSKEEVRAEKVDMLKSVKHVLFNIKPEINYPNYRFTINKDLPTANGDATMLYHIWSNLLDNAIKYSANAQQPQIEIGFKEKEGQTVYYVKDNGIGFNMDAKDRIFNIFVRLSGDAYSGSGIGLALVKQIIDKHHGRIWAESLPGKQTTFYFSVNNH